MSSDCGSQGLRFKSHRGTNVLWKDIDLHLPLSMVHPCVKWVPGRMRKLMWLDLQVLVKKKMPG